MEEIRNIYQQEVKEPAVGYFWKGLALFLLGIFLGIMMAPIKQGITIASHNDITNTESGNITPKGCCDSEEKDEEE